MERAELEAVRAGLFQPERGLYLAPIRHHSPACAAAVRAMIRAVKPRAVLIEGAVDFNAHIELILDKATKPPVAIVALLDRPGAALAPPGLGRVAAYSPFCAHSPEYVALTEARRLGATARFIDQEAAHFLRAPVTADPAAALEEDRVDAAADEAARAEEEADAEAVDTPASHASEAGADRADNGPRTNGPRTNDPGANDPGANEPGANEPGADAPLGPIWLKDERRFGAGAYIEALSARAGCRDGFELWDHLFETRLGDKDWRGFLADVGLYCAGVRASTDPALIEAQGDAAREARMATEIAAALAAGGPVVAVVGGFHAPALIEALEEDGGGKPDAPPPPAPERACECYLVRYSFAALDALNGYKSGLPSPGYYDALWRAAKRGGARPDWRALAADLTGGFAKRMRAEGRPISTPAHVELLRVAETVSRLRGRPGPLRHDLIDGVRAALLKGEGAGGEAPFERLLAYLRGDALGDVPASAGSPPLVEDARRRAKTHRLDIGDGARRRRRLDIRRKPAHAEASRFLHAMGLLETGFAVRDAGPDFLNDTRTDLLFEEWSYAWSPQVEARLIDCAAGGDTVRSAGVARLYNLRRERVARGLADDLDGMLDLFARGLLAGLGRWLGPFLVALAADIDARGRFESVARALRRLHLMALSKGPLSAPPTLDLQGVRAAAYRRLIFLCDDLPETPVDVMTQRLEALRLVVELLRGPDGAVFDRDAFNAAMSRVVAKDPPPEILGAALAVVAFATPEGAPRLVEAMAGRFKGAVVAAEDRIGVLRGALTVDPSLLWRVEGLLARVDGFLLALAEEDFLELLPHLRLAFTALTPRETDEVATRLAARHGGAAGAFRQRVLAASGEDLVRGTAVAARVREDLSADGLWDWLALSAAGGAAPEAGS